MWKDPIVEEIRKMREQHAKKYGYDIWAIYNDLKKEEEQSGRKFISLPPKLINKKET